MEPTEIESRIKSLYPDAQIETSGADCNFQILVVSDDFSGKRQVQRQQSILKLFSDEFKDGRLHALTVKAKTNEELEATKSNSINITSA